MSRRGDNIHKRKDGRWEGRYQNGFKSDGSIRYSSVYAHSYSECKEKLKNAITINMVAFHKRRSNPTFSDILYNWLDSNRIRLKGSTQAKYIHIIESHIIPFLGSKKIMSLDSVTINSFLDYKLKHGRCKDGSELSPSYVRTMAIIIEAAVGFAAAEGLCSPLKNPINKPYIPKKELNILDVSTELKITEIMKKDNSLTSTGVLLALQAGLRIGEVCALSWSDVNFDKSTIFVRHTVSRIQNTDNKTKSILVLDTPKTSSSIREVPIPSTLCKILLFQHKKRKSDYVVSDKNGFISTRTFDYKYRNLLRKNNLKIINFHMLRHTYATRCAESGMDAKTLSKILGHSSSTTSLNIYVHPTMEVAKTIVNKIYK